MKELKIILIFFLTLVSCSQKRNKIGHLEEFNLKGDVWQVIEHPYEGKGSFESYEILEIDRYNWEFPHKLIQFDENGFVIKECDIEWNGDIEKCTFQKTFGSKIIKESERDTIEIWTQKNGTREEFMDTINKGFTREYLRDGDLDIYKFSFKGYPEDNYSHEFKLNNNGQIIEAYWIGSDNKRHLGIENEYNPNGDIVLFKEYSINTDSLVKVRSFKYEYDNRKNWIQKIVFENKEVVTVVKRELYYFEDCFKKFTKSDLVGMWTRNKSERWIEFFENGKIDLGRGSSISETGSWELDEKSKRITFRIQDGGTKYDYKFSECNLILIDPTDKSDFDTYKKVDRK